jgi:hypothetical protein
MIACCKEIENKGIFVGSSIGNDLKIIKSNLGILGLCQPPYVHNSEAQFK